MPLHLVNEDLLLDVVGEAFQALLGSLDDRARRPAGTPPGKARAAKRAGPWRGAGAAGREETGGSVKGGQGGRRPPDDTNGELF